MSAGAHDNALAREAEWEPLNADDLLAGLSDEPFDLAPLRGTVADIKVSLGGLKVSGFEVGRVDLATLLRDGVLTAELRELVRRVEDGEPR